MKAHGACFGEVQGWERPLFFAQIIQLHKLNTALVGKTGSIWRWPNSWLFARTSA